MHGAVPLQRMKRFRVAKGENKTEARESRFPKEVISNSPEGTAITVTKSVKFCQVQSCRSLLKHDPGISLKDSHEMRS